MEVKMLLSRLAAGTATTEEVLLFNDWLDGLPEEEFVRIMGELGTAVAAEKELEPYREDWLQRMVARLDTGKVPRVRSLYPGRWAAAAVFLLLVGGLLLWRNKVHVSPDTAAVQPVVDVAPGRVGGVLTVQDGRE